MLCLTGEHHGPEGAVGRVPLYLRLGTAVYANTKELCLAVSCCEDTSINSLKRHSAAVLALR